MKYPLRSLFFSVILLSTSATKKLWAQYDEKYRPQYHFSAAKGWIGDPDGLVKFNGKYHLFWWGHAVSADLVHWTEMPYPMQGGDKSFHYFSGCVVVDKDNTAGFGDSSMIAVYTMHTNDSLPESQALSYSNDRVNFHFYNGNPVLDIQSNSFRDPQVFWHSATKRWIMIVARPHLHQIELYASANLKQWEHLSNFGQTGAQSSDWEVPDLFQLPVNGKNGIKKWVLTIGQGPNRVQYFLGDFDGKRFIPDAQTISQSKKKDPALWADYGTDFYAARTWRNEDDTSATRTTWLGWMGNWSYAGQVPTQWGKGFESVPRDITLTAFSEGVRLVQAPVPELKMLRRDSMFFSNKTFTGVTSLEEFKPLRNTYEIEATFDTKRASLTGFNLLVGGGRKLFVGYDTKKEKMIIDRTNCTDFITDSAFNKNFQVKMFAPLAIKNNIFKLHILVDKSSVEVFINDGKVVMSAVTFPAENQTGIELYSEGGKSMLVDFKGWMMSSIWK